LAIQGGGIVRVKKDKQQLSQSDFGFFKNYLYRFRMPGSSGANFPVGRIFNGPANIAWNDFQNSINTLKNGFGTPKTTAC